MTTPRKTPEPGSKPKFQVVESKLYYQTNAGDELALDLDLPMGVVLDALKAGVSQEEQFSAMLAKLGDEKTLRRFRDLGSISEGMPLVVRFFEEYAKAAGASLGESSGSARS